MSLRRKASKAGTDHWPTPAEATVAWLKTGAAPTRAYPVWEPCAGTGEGVAHPLLQFGYKVWSSDIEPRSWAVERADFFTTEPQHGCQIVTNPPYNRLEEFIARVQRFIDTEAVATAHLLLPIARLEGAKRFNTVYKPGYLESVSIYASRLTMYRDGEQTGGSGTVAYGWFKFSAPRLTPTELHWIPPF